MGSVEKVALVAGGLGLVGRAVTAHLDAREGLEDVTHLFYTAREAGWTGTRDSEAMYLRLLGRLRAAKIIP